jgi:hypothetical protein
MVECSDQRNRQEVLSKLPSPIGNRQSSVFGFRCSVFGEERLAISGQLSAIKLFNATPEASFGFCLC